MKPLRRRAGGEARNSAPKHMKLRTLREASTPLLGSTWPAVAPGNYGAHNSTDWWTQRFTETMRRRGQNLGNEESPTRAKNSTIRTSASVRRGSGFERVGAGSPLQPASTALLFARIILARFIPLQPALLFARIILARFNPLPCLLGSSLPASTASTRSLFARITRPPFARIILARFNNPLSCLLGSLPASTRFNRSVCSDHPCPLQPASTRFPVRSDHPCRFQPALLFARIILARFNPLHRSPVARITLARFNPLSCLLGSSLPASTRFNPLSCLLGSSLPASTRFPVARIILAQPASTRSLFARSSLPAEFARIILPASTRFNPLSCLLGSSLPASTRFNPLSCLLGSSLPASTRFNSDHPSAFARIILARFNQPAPVCSDHPCPLQPASTRFPVCSIILARRFNHPPPAVARINPLQPALLFARIKLQLQPASSLLDHPCPLQCFKSTRSPVARIILARFNPLSCLLGSSLALGSPASKS
ncbi:hypothetical protein C7M84_014855 [Penaeus vannamei]|uniref:Uncharacterized protein n=1 Tax=Penaeus vannamei TaxID=6689 RepID=A0A423SSE5_PENVA|nr:hypothetical protein C7M84_014855 [Penaeus vannamei]